MQFKLEEIFDHKLKKQVVQITIAAVILFVILLMKPQISGRYIVDKNGNVVAIEQNKVDNYSEYDIVVNIRNGKTMLSQDVKIHRLRDSDVRENDSRSDKKAEMSANLEYEIDKLEQSKNKHLVLPTKLDDGSSVIWEKPKSIKSEIAIIPLIYLMLVLSIVYSKYGSLKKKENIKREEILKYLPRFTNQLLLMISSGVILSDTFKRICDGYKMCESTRLGILENSILNITEVSKVTNQSIITLFNDTAKMYSVKELIRISTVLLENERRGSDVQEKLERESIYLWEMRKSVARERGKLIDTKMTYPLGVLLILLIVITMAPAMMTM